MSNRRIFEILVDMQFESMTKKDGSRSLLDFLHLRNYIINTENLVPKTATETMSVSYMMQKTAHYYIRYLEDKGYVTAEEPDWFNAYPQAPYVMYKLQQIIDINYAPTISLFEQRLDMYYDLRVLQLFGVIDTKTFESHLAFLEK